MKKFHIYALFALLLASTVVGCKPNKNDKEQEELKTFVDKINANPGRELPNGTILNSLDYAPGDSLLVYHIRVSDKRFDGVEADSVKAQLLKDLSLPDNKVLVGLLKRNNIGVKYIYTTESKEISVILSPAELGSSTQ